MLTKQQYMNTLMYEFKVELTKCEVSFADEQQMTKDALEILQHEDLQELIQQFCDYYNLLNEQTHSAILQ